MRAGKRTHVIEIQERTVGRNSLGEDLAGSWVKVTDLFVRPVFARGSEAAVDGADVSMQKVRFVAAYDPRVVVRMRAKYEGLIYSITAVQHLPQRNETAIEAEWVEERA